MNTTSIKNQKNTKMRRLAMLLLVAGMVLLFLSQRQNEAHAAPTNLIKNPSAETGTALPDFWSKGNWGTNAVVFTYPASGIDGARAMRIDVSSIADGDAKWYFEDAAVKPDTAYVFSDGYQSNVDTEAMIRYQTTSGTARYVFLGVLPASIAGRAGQFTFTTPNDVSSATVFHLINKAGYLVTDAYSLAEEGGVPPPPPPPPSSNLIANASFETVGQNGDPENWFRGSWGSNSAVFTYPATGADGGKAAKIEVSDYTDGDAKWYFANVPVVAGETYSFTDSYKSSVPTGLVARYQTATGGFLYQVIASIPPSVSWKTMPHNIIVPTGVTALSVFHTISTNGILEVDEFSLTAGSSPLPPSEVFSRGMVSFTFDDGWITQYADAFPILNTAGLKGTFYIVSQETLNAVPTERIINPLLETVGQNGDPENWFRGSWGSNSAVFTYPATGADGGKAAKIEVSNYTDGDAKWYFGNALVLPNEQYVLSESYQSNAQTFITIRYTYNDGTIQYADIASPPSSNGAWESFSKTIAIPPNVTSVSAFHMLRGNGSLMVDNYSLKLVPIYVNQAQMLEMQNAGHEIGGHTQTHISLSTVPPAAANDEIVGSRNELLGMGTTAVNTMAYPYGDYNASVKTMAKNAGFLAARSVDRGFNTKSADKYALKIQQMDRTTTMSDVQNWVSSAAADKHWLILMFHQEDGNPNHELGVTPGFLKQAADYVKTANVDVVTVAEGVSRMNP
jgi:peptidoglycan/xylan/chitin deacetylase (PgdA/CDA1 family)